MLDTPKPAIPFDTKQLDRLMDQAGIDVLLVNSKHSIQYLLGGHRSIFFDYMDAMGISRYLPILVYPKGAPEKAAYFGHRLETHQKEVNPFWTPESNTGSAGSVDAMQKAVEHVRRSGVKARHIGVETAFLPVDAYNALRGALADSEVKDGLFVLERLRAKKRPDELALLRKASELVVDSMKATMAKAGPRHEQARAVRDAAEGGSEPRAHLRILAGHHRQQPHRAPSDYQLQKGDTMSLDLWCQLPRLSATSAHGHPG